MKLAEAITAFEDGKAVDCVGGAGWFPIRDKTEFLKLKDAFNREFRLRPSEPEDYRSLRTERDELKAEVERQRTLLDRVLYLGAQFYMMKADNPKREKLWQEFSDLKYPEWKSQQQGGGQDVL